MDTVEPVDRVASTSRIALVATRVGIAEVVATRALQQITGRGRRVVELGAGAAEKASCVIEAVPLVRLFFAVIPHAHLIWLTLVLQLATSVEKTGSVSSGRIAPDLLGR